MSVAVVGFRRLVVVGRSVLVLLPQSLCTGELPVPSLGEFLQSRSPIKVKVGSFLHIYFCISSFAVFTVFSTQLLFF